MKNNNTIKIVITVVIVFTIIGFALLVKEKPYKVDTLNINYEIEGNKMNLEQYKIIHLPKVQWKNVPIPMRYTTEDTNE